MVDAGVRTRVFDADDLDDVLALCAAEGWTSYTDDPVRTLRALTAPGTLAVVATDDGRVVGVAHVLSDGEIQAHLAALAVDAGCRRRGIGRLLVERARRLSSARRLDALADDAATPFYDSLPARRLAGYRFTSEG